jgi:hypothetical protein
MPMIDGFQLAHKLLQKRSQCQDLFYNFRRNKYRGSKRSASTKEYWLLHQEANYYGTTAKNVLKQNYSSSV